MIIAARTGQGKTLCFGVPILDLCVRKIEKFNEKAQSSEEDESSGSDANGEESKKEKAKFQFDGVVGLILSPTRELAI